MSGVSRFPARLCNNSQKQAPVAKSKTQAAAILATVYDAQGWEPGSGKYPFDWRASALQPRGLPLPDPTCKHRNSMGSFSGGYATKRGLARAVGKLSDKFRPDLTNTEPAVDIKPHPGWDKIVSFDPRGHLVCRDLDALPQTPRRVLSGHARPTIAITKARLELPEIRDAITKGLLKPDGYLQPDGRVEVTKIAIDPVWNLPGVAKRLGADEQTLRRFLQRETGNIELTVRTDFDTYLPPIGATSVYIFGDASKISEPTTRITARAHDSCSGSDVFCSDICTCRPYLVHAIEECIKAVQEGGVGVIVYFDNEGRGLGAVTKYEVYNKRKRQGDQARDYFSATAAVAGVEDARFQPLMPDVFHWLGIKHIHRWVSMSGDKSAALKSCGITIGEQVEIPPDRIPQDAMVEIAAKTGVAGYATNGTNFGDVNHTVGQSYTDLQAHSKKQRGSKG